MANNSVRSEGEVGLAFGDSKGVRWERALFIKERVLLVGWRRLTLNSFVNSRILIFIICVFTISAPLDLHPQSIRMKKKSE